MNKLLALIGIVILILTGLVAKEVFDISNLATKNRIDHLIVNDCDLQSEICTFKFENKAMSFNFKHKPFYLNEVNQIKLQGELAAEVQVFVDFVGLEMDMGYNRPELKKNADGWMADIVLPTCARKTMTWQVTIVLQKNDKTTGFRYTMFTERK